MLGDFHHLLIFRIHILQPLRSQRIAKQLRNLLQTLALRLRQEEVIDEAGREVARNEQGVVPPMHVLDGDGRDLREHDGNDGFAEDAQSEAFGSQEEGEELDGHDPDHGVEEERVSEGIDEDECDSGTGAGYGCGAGAELGGQSHDDAYHDAEEAGSDPF